MSYFIVTAMVALLFSLLPFPASMGWLSPNWLVVALVLFHRYNPRHPMLAAFLLGMSLDVLIDGLLGMNALCCVVCAYFIGRYEQDLMTGSLVQQSGVIAIATGIYQLILLWVLGLTSKNPATLMHWMPVVSTTLIGPFVFRFVATRLPRRFGLSPTLL